MFAEFFAPDRMTAIYEWKYAMEHPYLFALIKILQPYAILIVIAGVIVRIILNRR